MQKWVLVLEPIFDRARNSTHRAYLQLLPHGMQNTLTINSSCKQWSKRLFIFIQRKEMSD